MCKYFVFFVNLIRETHATPSERERKRETGSRRFLVPAARCCGSGCIIEGCTSFVCTRTWVKRRSHRRDAFETKEADDDGGKAQHALLRSLDTTPRTHDRIKCATVHAWRIRMYVRRGRRDYRLIICLQRDLRRQHSVVIRGLGCRSSLRRETRAI